jgi:hypothetical protein
LAQGQSQFAKDEKALVEIVYNESVAGSFGGFRLEVVQANLFSFFLKMETAVALKSSRPMIIRKKTDRSSLL